MPKMRVLECPDCTHVWTFLAMKPGERNEPCPVCAGRPVEGLSAPALARGAAPVTTMVVPSNKTKAIDMGMRIASEDNGGANLKDRSRPGEVVALPVPIRPGEEPRWGAGLGGSELQLPTAVAMARADPYGSGRGQLLDRLARSRQPHMAPVYRDNTGKKT